MAHSGRRPRWRENSRVAYGGSGRDLTPRSRATRDAHRACLYPKSNQRLLLDTSFWQKHEGKCPYTWLTGSMPFRLKRVMSSDRIWCRTQTAETAMLTHLKHTRTPSRTMAWSQRAKAASLLSPEVNDNAHRSANAPPNKSARSVTSV